MNPALGALRLACALAVSACGAGLGSDTGHPGDGGAGADDAGKGGSSMGDASDAGDEAHATCEFSPAAWVGSYNLAFDGFTFAPPPQSHPDAVPGLPASEGAVARLDVRLGADGPEATIAMPHQAPVSMHVELASCELRLLGSAVVSAIACSDSQETWFGFGLPIGADGGPGATFHAWGQGPGIVYDYHEFSGVALEMTATGALQADTTPPRFRAEPEEAFAGGHWLPWQPIRWTSSEPVSADAWTAHLVATAPSSSSSVAVHWTIEPPATPESGWAGVATVRGELDSWEAASDGVLFEVTSGVTDPNGNTSDAVQVQRPLLDLGPPLQAHTFDNAPIEVATWGNAALVTGAEAALCESSTCLRIDGNGSLSRYLGIAGLLDAQGASRVRIRARLVGFDPQVDELVAEVAVPGLGVVASAEAWPLLSKSPQQPDGTLYASEWLNLDVVLPASVEADTVGFFVAPGLSQVEAMNALYACGYDAALLRLPFTLLVERIDALP